MNYVIRETSWSHGSSRYRRNIEEQFDQQLVLKRPAVLDFPEKHFEGIKPKDSLQQPSGFYQVPGPATITTISSFQPPGEC